MAESKSPVNIMSTGGRKRRSSMAAFSLPLGSPKTRGGRRRPMRTGGSSARITGPVAGMGARTASCDG